MNRDNQKTSWGKVANWYDKHLQEDDTYHSKVVLPNLMRLVDLKPTESMLELGCGQGFFTEKFFTISKDISGVDIGDQLINIAKRSNSEINYLVGSADDETILSGKSFDVVTIILALQNIKNLPAVTNNIARLMKENGRSYIVLNHPAFRIPQHSDWLYDDKKKIQSRKIDAYLNQIEINIDMNPGEIAKGKKKMTKSFHRSLQDYSKAFAKNKLAITKIEEWISHKKSEEGAHSKAEDAARKEFPMFMCLELKKVK